MTRANRLAAALMLTALVASPCFVQDTSSNGSEQAASEQSDSRPRWGVGAQLSPLFGLSVRYALAERWAVQAAGLPFLVGGETTVGARVLYKLRAQPSYNFYVSGGSTLFVDTQNRGFITDEDEGTDIISFFFVTLGGEYRFAERLGLGGGLGFNYTIDGPRSPFIEDDGRNGAVAPVLELGLHYYF